MNLKTDRNEHTDGSEINECGQGKREREGKRDLFGSEGKSVAGER